MALLRVMGPIRQRWPKQNQLSASAVENTGRYAPSDVCPGERREHVIGSSRHTRLPLIDLRPTDDPRQRRWMPAHRVLPRPVGMLAALASCVSSLHQPMYQLDHLL